MKNCCPFTAISYMYWLKANMDRRKRDSMAELKAKYEQSGLG